MSKASIVLRTELDTYKANLDKWSDENGKFTLIKGDEVVGFYPTSIAALQEGYKRFKLDSFLVKRICIVDPVQFVPLVTKTHTSLRSITGAATNQYTLSF